MAKYRQIHLTFWQDPFIEELEPLQKYFYLYLMTNSKTTQCGCYEISMKLMKYETGLKQTQIDGFIKLFEDCNKIGYNKANSEFLIINWLKHNSFKSPKVKACIHKELSSIKTVFYKEYINTILDGKYPIDSLLVQVQTPIDTQSQQEREQEREQEELFLSQYDFEDSWIAFGNYGTKSKAVEYWNKLKEEDKALIVQRIPIYLNHLVISGFQKKMFQGWINPKERLFETTYENSTPAQPNNKHESQGQILRSSEPIKTAPQRLDEDGNTVF